MRHVVIVTSEISGRVQVAVELAGRLEAAGHRATLASPDALRGRFENLDYVRLAPVHIPGTIDPVTTSTRLSGLMRRFADIGSVRPRRAAKVGGLGIDTLARKLAELDPDLVVVDVELPVVVMTAVGAGHHVAVWTTMLSVWKRPGLPPLGSATVPGAGWRGSRLGIELEWLWFRVGKWVKAKRLRITRTGLDQLSTMQAVAARTGFPLAETSRFHWLVPYVFPQLPMLSFTAQALEFPHDPAPSMHYVGPLLDRSRDSDSEEIERLHPVYHRRATEPDRRIVYCGFGAWHKGDDRDFIRRVIAIGARRPNWDLIIGLGSRVEHSDLGPVTDNVHLLGWAPQLDILHHADSAIHHGGISSVNECIVAGVPMVLYPFDFLDQPGNAARVAFHQMGVVGSRSDSSAAVESKLDEVMKDSRYGDAVATMRREVELLEGKPVATIEALLD